MTTKDRKTSRQSDATPQNPLMSEHDRAVLAVGRRLAKVRIGGETREVSVHEAVAMRTSQSALEGNSHAQWLALKMFADAEHKAAAEKAAERRALKHLYLHQHRRLRAALAAGEPTDLILPHPDDIDFTSATGPAIRGPACVQEWQDTLTTARIRDAYLKQDALDRALTQCRRKASFVPFDAASLATMINLSLPERLRLSDCDLVSRRMADAALPIRVLLKQCRAHWQAAGYDMPRGSPSLSPTIMRDLFHVLATVFTRFNDGGMNPRQIPALAREADAEIAAIFQRARQGVA